MTVADETEAVKRRIERPAMDKRPALLEEKLSLEAQMEPIQKRLQRVNKELKDLVTKAGPYTDEGRGLVVMIEPRTRILYDADLLRKHFPDLARGVIVESVDAGRMKQAIAIGEVTESELEAVGARIREAHSRAMVVKPLKEARPYDR